MLDQQGYLCFYERYNKSGKLKLKTGKRIFHGIDNSEYKNKHQVAGETSGSLRLNISKYGSSGRRKFCFADWDQDGDLDLLVNSINISLLENIETKNSIVYFKNRGELSEHLLAGHTTNPTIVDWDKNSIPDLLIGAEDGHFYFLENPHSGKQ
jgi:hypothetical protein